MKAYAILILAICMTSSSSEKMTAEQLWKEQMSELDELLAREQIPKESSSKSTRAIGLDHFGIQFEGEVEKMTVHTLRPGDIDIIGAMGDSITAANGAEADTIVGLIIEYRSVCYSIGGVHELEESITLPNILKKFNPKIDGFSYANGPRPPRGQYSYGFNVAVPGARADDMYGQAERLIELLKNDNRTNYERDWKLITMFIGGNDLCALGRDPEGASAETYVAEIKRAIDLLHSQVPRMLLNIVDFLDIHLLYHIGYGYGSSAVCRAMQQTFCGYVINSHDDPSVQAHLIEVNEQYQIQLQALIDSGQYDTRDDFTVVIQPFFRDTVLPYTESGEVDSTYFAPDCFHFSDIGHAMTALNTWNNMLEPVGKKSTVWNITDLKVPTKEHPYIFTSKNSEEEPLSTVEPTEEPSPENAPDWLIAVIAVLVVFLLGEALALFCIVRSNKKVKPVEETISCDKRA